MPSLGRRCGLPYSTSHHMETSATSFWSRVRNSKDIQDHGAETKNLCSGTAESIYAGEESSEDRHESSSTLAKHPGHLLPGPNITMNNHPLTQRWLSTLSESRIAQQNDRPNYWHADPTILLSTSTIHTLTLGTGASLYTSSILPCLSTATQEVILVTCFWAPSATLAALNGALLDLSAKGQRLGRRIRVRIYFSSSSLTQKLFHPQTPAGKVWEPGTWKAKLGLPGDEELPGLDVRVKSVFLLPFSVMHPKFVIVDRETVVLPSCNVSWEDWFEGCVTLSGDIVGQFVRFWREFWATEEDARSNIDAQPLDAANTKSDVPHTDSLPLASRHLNLADIPTLFLPSPHHLNPRFALLPWRSCPPAPRTPLNAFLLTAFETAERSIYVQTPNLTAPPILSALLAGLRRGVDVEIVTSEKLMILEQLVTAGTTTRRCLRTLVKRYRRLSTTRTDGRSGDSPALVESAVQPGKLSISYYQPLAPHLRKVGSSSAEPVQSHLKLSIVDAEWVVLGSGNLDRASVFTSQELGVAIVSREFAGVVRGEVGTCLEGRRKETFRSWDG